MSVFTFLSSLFSWVLVFTGSPLIFAFSSVCITFILIRLIWNIVLSFRSVE